MKTVSGIIAAQDGQTINNLPLAYNSSNSHLIIDSRESSGHLGIKDLYCGSQVWTLDSGIASYNEEIFLEIYHGLPFIPKVLLYSLIRDAPPTFASFIGYYMGGYIDYGAAGVFNERIWAKVGKTSIKFMRSASSSGVITDPAYRYTMSSTFQKFRMRYKYMICSNEESSEEYEILPGS